MGRVAGFVAVWAGFVLVLIYLLCARPSIAPELDLPLLTQATDAEAWTQFLFRRKTIVPPLPDSLDLWEKAETTGKEVNNHSPALEPYPSLDAVGNAVCFPRKFGFEKTQADAVYNPSRTFKGCGDPATGSLHLANK